MNHRPRRSTAVHGRRHPGRRCSGPWPSLGSRHRPRPRAHRSADGFNAVGAPPSSSSRSDPPGRLRLTATSKDKDNDKPTATTQPSRIVALSSTPPPAIYPVGRTSYQVTVSGPGPCWVAGHLGPATGSTLWTGTLQAGGSRSSQATGVVTVELGAPTRHADPRQGAGGPSRRRCTHRSWPPSSRPRSARPHHRPSRTTPADRLDPTDHREVDAVRPRRGRGSRSPGPGRRG